MAQFTNDPADLVLLRSLGVVSLLVVPLVMGQRTLGVMTWLMMESGRNFGMADRDLAMLLGRRAALAVDGMQLYRAAQEGLVREQALGTAAEKLVAQHQAILRQIADGVVTADRDGRIIFVNEAARQRFGIRPLA